MKTQILYFLKSRRTSLIFLFIVVLGLYLRVRNLGHLGFQGDEDITTLAVKGILEHGYPLFASGMIYLRSLPFLYLLAASAKVLGLSELALRMPAALFSTGTILLAYLFTKRLFGQRVGLLVAAAVAVSPWEIQLARTARMYAPFQFFYLLTLFSFYRHYIEEEGSRKYVTTLLAIFTCTIHLLGFTLSFLFLFPLLLNRFRSANRLHLISNSIAVAALFLIWREVVHYYLHLPLWTHQSVRPLLNSSEQGYLTAWERLLAPFHAPSFDLLASVYQNSFPVFMTLSLIMVVLVGLFLVQMLNESRRFESIILLLVTVFVYLHQFTLGLLLLFLFCFVTKEGLFVFKRRKVMALALAMGLAFALWLIYGVAFWEGNEYVLSGISSQFRQTLKALIDFPRLFIRAFFDEMPIVTLFAGLGFLWCLHTGSRNAAEKKPLFILYAFTVPLLIHGMMGSGIQLVYNFQLDVMFFILAVLALLNWPGIAEIFLPENAMAQFSRQSRLIPHLSIVTAISGCLILTVVVADLNPSQSWLLTEQDYYQEGPRRGLFEKFSLKYYPDHKSTAEYVKKHMSERDVIIVMDWLAQYNYIGRTDYWIRTSEYEGQVYMQDGRLRDLYTGAFLIPDLEQLKRIVSQNKDRRIWIVTSSLEVRNLEKVTEDVVQFLDNLSDYLVYVGKDRESKVYLLGSSDIEKYSPDNFFRKPKGTNNSAVNMLGPEFPEPQWLSSTFCQCGGLGVTPY